MLVTLLLSALARAADGCALPQTLDALRGDGPPLHAGMIAAPSRVGRVPSPPDALPPDASPPPDGAKAVYGTNYEHHLETENFTINWWDTSIPDSYATLAGEALETAWRVFVEESGWVPPVSSEDYYIWVLLDPELGSTTGYTTTYFTDDYPQGYPVIYLNPSSMDFGEAFWTALSEHELMHALQYAVRRWDGTYEGESWYWEASATWASELADPDVNGHEYTSAWYAEQADLRYDSREGGHDYGIFVLNGWMEEHLTGPGGMLAVWTLGGELPDEAWDSILASATGVGVDALWGGFTGAYGNRQLAESDRYTRVTTEGTLEDGAEGTLPYLGTHYYRARESTTVRAEGDVVLAGADGASAAVDVVDGDILAVTGLADDSSYVLHFGDPEPVDTGGGEGGGEGGSDGGDTGDAPSDTGATDKGGCACSAIGAPSLSWLAVALGLSLRRRSAPPCRTRPRSARRTGHRRRRGCRSPEGTA